MAASVIYDAEMETHAQLRPIELLWQPATLISIFAAGELLAIILALTPAESESRLIAFGLLSFAIQWVTLFTLAAMYGMQSWLARMRPIWVVATALSLLAACSLASARVAHELLGPLWTPDDGAGPGAATRFTATLLSMALLGLLALRARWNAHRFAYEAKKAELAALHARIRPHFLFNALNAGAALVHHRPEQAEQLLLDLADLFRAALTGPRSVTLDDELSLVRRYLEIETMRFGDRLRVRWALPSPLPETSLPVLSLQPLVENAVRHGIEPSPDGGDVEISVETMADAVVVRVANTLPSTLDHRDGHRVGLKASKARIEADTQGVGRVETHVEHGRFVATVRLPLVPQVTTR